jgi:hypothetical protein
MVHSVGPALDPLLNPIGFGGLLTRWPEAGVTPRVSNPHDYVNHMFKKP